MPKDKGYPDQFNLGQTEKTLGKKRLSEQPTKNNNVPGINVNTIGNRPSESRNVPGSKLQGSKS